MLQNQRMQYFLSVCGCVCVCIYEIMSKCILFMKVYVILLVTWEYKVCHLHFCPGVKWSDEPKIVNDVWAQQCIILDRSAEVDMKIGCLCTADFLTPPWQQREFRVSPFIETCNKTLTALL
jgi:hypothetical protein